MSGQAQWIRAARAYAEKTQPDMAAVLEMSVKTYKWIEMDRREAKRSELLAIAEACEVPMWFLEGGWGNYPGSVDDQARRALADVEEPKAKLRRMGGADV